MSGVLDAASPKPTLQRGIGDSIGTSYSLHSIRYNSLLSGEYHGASICLNHISVYCSNGEESSMKLIHKQLAS